VNAHSIVADAVAQALFQHDARYPWKRCSCGWLNPSRHLNPRAIKEAFWCHVADAVAENVIERMRQPVPTEGMGVEKSRG
jgi:hypothetical protein